MKFTTVLKRSAAAVMTILAVGTPITAARLSSASAAGNNADKVVQYAKTKTYITSRPNEVTNFYGLVCDWCSMFVYYCAYQNGVGNAVPNTTFCDSQYGYKGGVEIFKSWGRWKYSSAKGGSYVPVKGDVIYFDWNLDGYSDHVGFVDYTENGYVHTVEGNSGTYGDCVKLNKYSLSYKNILGYGTPDWGDSVSKAIAPAAYEKKSVTVITAAKSDVKLPAEFKVSSPVGAWLREEDSSTGKKLGILSTDQLLTADKICGEWVHVQETSVEGSSRKYSGWTAMTNLTFVKSIDAEVTTKASSTTSTTTKTTVTTTSTSKRTTAVATRATTAASSVKAAETTCVTYRVDSSVGAWFRTSPKFDGGIIGVLDTDSIVQVYSIDGEWAYGQASVDGKTFKTGYVHMSTLTQSAAESSVTKYRVTSSIGCWLRKDPVVNNTNMLEILNTGDTFEVLSVYGEWAFAKISSCIDGSDRYGYVHTSNIEKV